MPLERHYFISSDMDDLERFGAELTASGIAEPQLHVLSRDNASVHRHRQLTGVSSFMKRDLIHSGFVGAVVGLGMAIGVLWITWLNNWHQGQAGLLPFLFLAAALFGASTWVGGLLGMQRPNHHFRRFQSVLDAGRHVFFVDLDPSDRPLLDEIRERHPTLESQGTGEAQPGWAIAFHNFTQKWWYWRLWKNA